MPTNYAGDPTNYPAEIQLPSDGDPKDAASVNAALEGLADRTAALAQLTGQTAEEEFTDADTPGEWEAPANVRRVLIEACGGGGGGGGGAGGSLSGDVLATGGGGGGAAPRRIVVLDVTPGTTYEITIGKGGDGGAGGDEGDPGVDGSDGDPTTFAVKDGATLATFEGGKGGAGGRLYARPEAPFGVNSGTRGMVPGGGPTLCHRPRLVIAGVFDTQVDEPPTLVFGPGFGGDGRSEDGTAGADSIEGYAGGAGGTRGSHGGGRNGGGGGGGGAAGPYGAGLDGFDGGAGGDPSGTGGATGGGASVNTGAGGGGGGAGGGGTSAGGTGSNGRPGGSGRLILRVIG